jgi:hypothetical protein
MSKVKEVFMEGAQSKLQEFADTIVTNGPTRVLLDCYGTAVSPQRALNEYGIEPEVIFIREDGWSLGAPRQLQEQARKLWRKEWIGVLWLPNTTPEPLP